MCGFKLRVKVSSRKNKLSLQYRDAVITKIMTNEGMCQILALNLQPYLEPEAGPA